jgi:hypothetical protein
VGFKAMTLYVNNLPGQPSLEEKTLGGVDFTGYIESGNFSLPIDLRLFVEECVCSGIRDEKKREELAEKIRRLDSLSLKIMAKLCKSIITIYYTPEEFSRICQENLYRDMKLYFQKSC